MEFHHFPSQVWKMNTNIVPPKSTTVAFDKLGQAIPFGVQLSLTIVFTALYALLFLFIWIQLILILVYRHKRLSYQSVFLYLCLLWAALRTTLFSFYFNNNSLANRLPVGWKWLLYSFPIALQFLTLSLLALYFSQVVLKSLTTYEPHVRYRKRRYLFIVFGSVNFIFFVLNILDVILVDNEPCCRRNVVLTRVVINQTLFVVTSFALCYCIIKLSRASTGNLLLEGQGTTLCQASVFCVIIGLLYVSRAVYDIIAVSPVNLPSFGYGWINVSDEGEASTDGHFTIEGARDYGYVSFGVVLFVWEFLPTFFVVVFFRVKRPQQGLGSIITSGKENRKTYFFDNPDRYNSDDDLPTTTSQHLSYDIPGMESPNATNGAFTINNSSLQRINSYGSTGQPGFQKTPGSYQSHLQGSNQAQLLSQENRSPLLGTRNSFVSK